MTNSLSEHEIKKARSIKKNAEKAIEFLVDNSVDGAALMTTLTIIHASIALMINQGENPTEFFNTFNEKTEELYAMLANKNRQKSSE